MSFLLVFSLGDFERLYLSFSRRTYMQIRESWNFKISREIAGVRVNSHLLPGPSASIQPVHSPAGEGTYFLMSFQGSLFYFWDNLFFRKFSPLSRKSLFIQSLPIGLSYTSHTLLIIFTNFTIWKTGAKMGKVTCAWFYSDTWQSKDLNPGLPHCNSPVLSMCLPAFYSREEKGSLKFCPGNT